MRWLFLVLLSWCLSTTVSAEEPVYFADPNLKLVVEQSLQVSDPTPTDMLGLTQLARGRVGIVDITGLEYATNLQSLLLRGNQVSDLSPLSGLTNLQKLFLNVNRISDASPLSGLTDLRVLVLHDNRISDLSFLSDLTQMENLDLHMNLVCDIAPLAGLSNLAQLNLMYNHISDITPLLGLTGLEQLRLRYNPLDASAYCSHLRTVFENNPRLGLVYSPNCAPPTDVTVSGGTFPDRVRITWEPVCNGPVYGDSRYYRVSRALSVEGLQTPISEWQSTPDFDDATAEPGTIYAYRIQTADTELGRMSGEYSAPALGWVPGQAGLTIGSGPGGAVPIPGEGMHAVEVGQIVDVHAAPIDVNLYSFTGWTGTAVLAGLVADPNAASTTVTINEAHSALKATFLSKVDTVYVDDDAPNDPGPDDGAVSDPLEDGTDEHPFDTIQEGIDVAAGGATVIVRHGTYRECITFRGRNVTVIGFDPNAPLVPEPYPVIDANYAGTAVTFDQGEDPNCVLAGFVVTRGAGEDASAIRCERSSPTIANCLVVGNRPVSTQGGAVYCVDSSAVFVNCTVVDNAAEATRGNVYLSHAAVALVNCIVWGDTPASGVEDVFSPRRYSLSSVTYCDVVGGQLGAGNLDADPLFVRRGHWVDPDDASVIVGADARRALWVPGDYHLQSQAGRWDPITRSWVQDDVTSPCIDMGDPSYSVGSEPAPDGGVINMGAYGGSTQASLGR